MFWNIGEGQIQSLSDYFITGPYTGYKVANDGTMVGSFPDENIMVPLEWNGEISDYPINTGGVWKDGEWTSFGVGLFDGTVTSGMGVGTFTITPDGKHIGGYTYKRVNENNTLYPCVWTKTGENWVAETWAQPEGITQGSVIRDMSNDGKVAVGWANFGSGSWGVIWKSKDECILPKRENGDIVGAFFDVSANGRYALARSEGQTTLYDIERDEFIDLGAGLDYPETLGNGVSNDGTVVGCYLTSSSVRRSFIWSFDMGFMELKDFISLYLSDLTIPLAFSRNFNDGVRGNNELVAISADGMMISGYAKTTNIATQPFIIKLDGALDILPYPENLTAVVADRNDVTISWDALSKSDEELTGYNVFRNEESIATITAEKTSYTDEGAPAGYHDYTVQALYGEKTSRVSRKINVAVVDNYDIPFVDDFESRSIKTNYWTTEITSERENHVSFAVNSLEGIGGTGNIDGYSALSFYTIYNSGVYDASAISKLLDATDKANVYLSYIYKADYYNPGIENFSYDVVHVDVFDGTEWQTVNTTETTAFKEWATQVLDLSSYAANKMFKFRFRVEGENFTTDAKRILFDNVSISTSLPEGAAVPKNLLASTNNDEKLELAWQNPNMEVYALTYAKSNSKYAVGRGDDETLIAVNSFDKKDLEMYDGLYMTSISAYINQKAEILEGPTEIRLAVFVDGERVSSQTIDSFVPRSWNTFVLASPIELNAVTQNLKFGIEVVSSDALEETIGCDATRNPVTGKGDLFSVDGGQTWKSMTDEGTVNNWCIIGDVTAQGKAITYRDFNVYGYNVYRDGVKVNEDLIFAQSYLMENIPACYTVKGYSLTTYISAASNEKYAGNFIIEASAEGEGNIDPAGSVPVAYGTDKAFSFAANEGYILSEVLVDGVNIPEAVTSKAYTFQGVNLAHTIVAKFEKDNGSGINDIEVLQISVSPNPTTDRVTISNNENINTVQLFDTTGKQVYMVSNINKTETVIDFTSLPNGVYFLKVDGKTIKVVKQ